MSKKTINDVLEYLYEQKRKDLAAIVIAELRQPVITTSSEPRRFINIPNVYTQPIDKPHPTAPFDKPTVWMGSPETKPKKTITQ